jgi:hypothetical protein
MEKFTVKCVSILVFNTFHNVIPDKTSRSPSNDLMGFFFLEYVALLDTPRQQKLFSEMHS